MDITGNLASSNKLGEGAFGEVYLGELKGTQDAVKVAVKVCSKVSSAHSEEQFINEVDIIVNSNCVALLFSFILF